MQIRGIILFYGVAMRRKVLSKHICRRINCFMGRWYVWQKRLARPGMYAYWGRGDCICCHINQVFLDSEQRQQFDNSSTSLDRLRWRHWIHQATPNFKPEHLLNQAEKQRRRNLQASLSHGSSCLSPLMCLQIMNRAPDSHEKPRPKLG